MPASKSYPLISGASKHKKKGVKCKCGENSTYKTFVQFNYFRGDDEMFFTCEKHKKDISFLIGE